MIPANNLRSLENDERPVPAAFARLVQAARRLVHDISIGRTNSPNFDNVHELLGTVPLATDEHSVSVQRLQSARHYAAHGEAGAACYELNLLVHNFAARSKVQVIE
jgi:hypothetical protein